MRPYLPPLIRSLAAPIAPNRPSRAHGVVAPELYVDSEGISDRGNPYGYGGERVGVPPHSFDPTHGQLYTAPPAIHHARAFGAPLEPRTAFGTAYVTPVSGWGLHGVASGWSRPGPFSVLRRQPTAKLAMGRLGQLHTGSPGAAKPPLPTLPEAQRMIWPQL